MTEKTYDTALAAFESLLIASGDPRDDEDLIPDRIRNAIVSKNLARGNWRVAHASGEINADLARNLAGTVPIRADRFAGDGPGNGLTVAYLTQFVLYPLVIEIYYGPDDNTDMIYLVRIP